MSHFILTLPSSMNEKKCPRWNFKNCLTKLLSDVTLTTRLTNETKYLLSQSMRRTQLDEKSPVLDLLRDGVNVFTGGQNPCTWFNDNDSKIAQLKLSMTERIETVPFFLAGDAMLWFCSNREKIHSYVEFCQLFSIEYLRPDALSSNTHTSVRQRKRTIDR